MFLESTEHEMGKIREKEPDGAVDALEKHAQTESPRNAYAIFLDCICSVLGISRLPSVGIGMKRGKRYSRACGSSSL